MSPSVSAAIAAIRSAVDLLEVAVADSEPAPISVVLVRDRSNGRVHRRARIAGMPGLLSYEADNADLAGVFDVIPDLSKVSDDLDLCGRCFGETDNAETDDPIGSWGE